ncbi:hypothetical protein GW17_00022687 [Ensete ventricosum]|nr:hypothetical protein GW17_00022687 [Ensete ventricosum]
MEVALMSIVLVGSLLTCKGGTHGQGRPLEGRDDHSWAGASFEGRGKEWPTLCARGTTRTSKRRRMRSAQRLRWLSSSYSSTLATKLDGAQEMRGIANLKDSVLMQGLVHGRRSVRGHPKARSELGAVEHQNFLFNIERIRS